MATEELRDPEEACQCGWLDWASSNQYSTYDWSAKCKPSIHNVAQWSVKTFKNGRSNLSWLGPKTATPRTNFPGSTRCKVPGERTQPSSLGDLAFDEGGQAEGNTSVRHALVRWSSSVAGQLCLRHQRVIHFYLLYLAGAATMHVTNPVLKFAA